MVRAVPTDGRIRALHARYAPTGAAFDLVWTHCRIVCSLAEQVLARHRGSGLDERLVRAGALLHDIGVYRLYGPDGVLDGAHYLRHGVLGHELLRGLGLPERLCRFCSCHTGVGLTAEDVVRWGLPIPVRDYVARTREEEIVMYADTFHSKRTPPTFVSPRTAAAELARFGEDKVAAFAAMRSRWGDPDLAAPAAAYGHPVG